MARTAAMTRAEFRQLFRNRFGREYNDVQPPRMFSPRMFSPQERSFIKAFVVGGYVWDQVTYGDPVTGLMYEIFYEFDYDAGQAVVAYALRDGKKVRLTRGLRQRMEQAACDQWLAEAIEDSAEEIASSELRFAPERLRARRGAESLNGDGDTFASGFACCRDADRHQPGGRWSTVPRHSSVPRPKRGRLPRRRTRCVQVVRLCAL